MNTVVNFASYWRSSLADTAIGKGILSHKDVGSFIELENKNVFKVGKLDENVVNELFKGHSDDEVILDITFRPNHYKLIKSHGSEQNIGLPVILSPLICQLYLHRSGYLYPAAPAMIARDVLSPLDRSEFTVGSIDNLDEYLTSPGFLFYQKEEIPVHLTENDIKVIKEGWDKYYVCCRELFHKVCGDFISQNKEDKLYLSTGKHYLYKNATVLGMTRNILSLYDDIVKTNGSYPLFQNYATKVIETHSDCISYIDSIDERLGHASDVYGLAPAQRDALSHTVNMKSGELLAVNGPPGTGKTTFVLSAVASLWVDAALKHAQPPIILAASINNQAVTNVIDAFGKDFSEGNDDFSGRWLPDIRSYGAYFPAKSKEKEVEGKYQTPSFYDQLEDLVYVDKAKKYFLQMACVAMGEDTEPSLSQVKQWLHAELKSNHDFLLRIKLAWNAYQVAISRLEPHSEKDIYYYLSGLQNKLSEIESKQKYLKEDEYKWTSFLEQESIWLSIFSWIPAIKNKERLGRKLFLDGQVYTSKYHDFPDDNEVLSFWFLQGLKQADIEKQTLRNEIDAISILLEDFEKAQINWRKIAALLVNEDKAESATIEECDLAADIKIRFKLFRISIHYWEARWLESLIDIGSRIDELKKKKGKQITIDRWRRRMMLTPCIVSTFHSLPSHLTYTAYDDEQFHLKYLYDFVDLLIVDEAGQVSPEVAGATFSLAKKALVIGDIHQIPPVRGISSAIEIGNLQKSKILCDSNEYQHFRASGRSVTVGSVMHVAQQASRYQYLPDMEAGMYLLEHRRCYDELITYCNKLCYNGQLIPKRGLSENSALFPPFGYLHINGRSEMNSGGSRKNTYEAVMIAEWLYDNKSSLEAYYKDKLSNIVGVITPFKGQKEEIKQACEAKGIDISKFGLTVGTVHALQGAERKVILFSSVYSKHSDGQFIDSDKSMLNVAVSRAKDSFLVFGDMDVFLSVSPSKPRGMLAEFLLEKEENELTFKVLPRPDIKVTLPPLMLNNSKEHDEYLKERLEQVSTAIHIVSPWILEDRLVSTGFLDLIKLAIAREAIVSIYTDVDFNTKKNNKFNDLSQKKFNAICNQLIELGVQVFFIKGIHSKLIFSDDNFYCAGSYNWFSAVRGEKSNLESSIALCGDVKAETELNLSFILSKVAPDYVNQFKL